ncbi:MAG: hypothetical protein VYA34_05815 [Myxococcota bacterium]|nr:hypothetical protein [Myxococcota bacterium]
MFQALGGGRLCAGFFLPQCQRSSLSLFVALILYGDAPTDCSLKPHVDSDISLLHNTQMLDFMTYTVATHRDPLLLRFIESAVYFDIPFKVLAFGEKWPCPVDNQPGFGWRILLMREVLKKLHKDSIVMVTDCFDVVLSASPKEIISKFKAFDCPIVFSAEMNVWPDPSLKPRYPEHPSPFRFLNAGGYIGYVGALGELFNGLEVDVADDDQLVLSRHFLDAPGAIRLDHECSIFQTLYKVHPDSLIYNSKYHRVMNLKMGSFPCVFHGNGNSRPLLDHLCQEFIPPADELRTTMIS